MKRPPRDDQYLSRLREVHARAGRMPEFVARCSPYVRIAHIADFPAGYRNGVRRIADHALLYVHKGRGAFEVEGVAHPFGPGTVLFARPLVWHDIVTTSAVHMLNLHFDVVEHADSSRADYLFDQRRPRRQTRRDAVPDTPAAPGALAAVHQVADVARYELLYAQIHRRFPLPGVGNRLAVKAALTEMLALLYLRSSDRPTAEDGQSAVQAAVDAIAADLARDWSVARLAQRARLSTTVFARRFKAATGATPIDYLRQVRIERARMELLAADEPVKLIAERVGFANVHHFTRVFARVVGVAPATYRRLARARSPG